MTRYEHVMGLAPHLRHCLIVAAAWGLGSAAAAGQAPATPCTQDPAIIGATRLMEAGLYDRAQEVAAPLLARRETVACAASLMVRLEEARRAAAAPGRLGTFGDQIWVKLKPIFEWAGALLALAGLALLFGGFWRAISAARRWLGYGSWRVRSVAATSDPGVLSAWRAALNQNRKGGDATYGLLGRTVVPVSKSVIIRGDFDETFATLLTGAPVVGGVSLTWIGSVVQTITRECHSPRRSLTVSIIGRDKSVTMRVDAIDSDNQIRSEAMVAAWTTDAEAAAEIGKLARGMATRTSYLISAKPDEAPARIRLQEGVARLDDFATRQQSAALSEAAQAFAEARLLDPNDVHATLYEGLARELLEEHDLAAALFQRVIDTPGVAVGVVSNARYNLAISHLRRYNPPALAEAEKCFDALLGDPAFGMKPDAHAALANVIAQKFNFWEKFEPKGERDFRTWSPADAKTKLAQLRKWSKQIHHHLARAKKALDEEGFRNDPAARTQLLWSIDNVRGNHALNQGKAAWAPLGLDRNEARAKFEKALAAYRRCEVLVPPGVETLSSIASVLIQLNRPSEAIKYARRARLLNRAYEFAYYREAQAQRQRGDRAAFGTVLRDAAAALDVIAIPGFQDLFRASRVPFHAS